jgi:tetratricopeptide (TPR) repeat protein
LARPAGQLERAVRWCRRNPRVVALTITIAGLLILIAAGSVTATVLIAGAYGRAESDRLAATAAGERAEASARAAATDLELALDGYNTLIQKVQSQIKSQPGLLPLRRALLETAADGLKRVVGGPDDTVRVDRLMVVAHDRLADLYLTLGRTPDARREYEAMLDLARQVADRMPESRDARRAVANAHDKLGMLASISSNVPALTDHYTQAFNIRRQLFEQYPADRNVRRELSISWHKLGDASMTAGEPAKARERYEESLRMIEARPPGDDPAERPIDLRFRHTRIALACLALGDVDAADRHAKTALENARALAQLDPVMGRHELAASVEQAAQVALCRLDPATAVAHRREVVNLRRAAVAADPDNREAERNLAVALYLLGDAAAATTDLPTVRTAYAEHLKLCSGAIAADPGSLQKGQDLALAYERQMLLAEAEGRFTDAATWAGKNADLCRRAEPDPRFAHLHLTFWRMRRETEKAMYEAAAKFGLDDSAIFAPLPPPVRAGLLRLRALTLALKGKTDEATAAASELQRVAGGNAEAMAVTGRVFALLAKSVGENDRRNAFADSAIAALREAIRLDPTTVVALVQFPEFVALRDRPDFRELLRPAATKSTVKSQAP